MSHDMLVGLQITDPEAYAAYRAAITPMLHAAGGRFRHDFSVSEVLASEARSPIDRLFVISFPDRAAAEGFFAGPDYRAARAEHYEPSVAATAILAAYEESAA